MPRLIDANFVVYCAESEFSEEDTAKVRWLISHIPTIDAEPVRHGRWIHTTREDSDWGGTFHRYTCSACRWSMGDNPTGWGLFCPNCGAKMDAEVKE